ncbi:hypothetical protein ACOSQ2_019022 [Xanthoceras sorbifolium]
MIETDPYKLDLDPLAVDLDTWRRIKLPRKKQKLDQKTKKIKGKRNPELFWQLGQFTVTVTSASDFLLFFDFVGAK